MLRLLVLAGVGLIFALSFSVYREIEKKKAVQAEIEALQREAEKISRENSDIAEKISYLESRDYKEREAKEKLNLQSPDETVVVITPNSRQESRENVPEKSVKNITEVDNNFEETSNPHKWWNYFFKY